jgi:serine/threonine protein kinase
LRFYDSWINEDKAQAIFITEFMVRSLSRCFFTRLFFFFFLPRFFRSLLLCKKSAGTVKQFLSKKKAPPRLRVIKHWALQILRGLEYLHTQSPPVIHRDIKCDNIFLHEGNAKIGDLGLATYALAATHQKALSVIGTPQFMAPEVYDETYTTAADIWAYGMAMIEMLTNTTPYSECESQPQIFKRVTTGVLPRALYLIVDDGIRSFLSACLSPHMQRPSATVLLRHSFFTTKTVDEEQPIALYSVEEADVLMRNASSTANTTPNLSRTPSLNNSVANQPTSDAAAAAAAAHDNAARRVRAGTSPSPIASSDQAMSDATRDDPTPPPSLGSSRARYDSSRDHVVASKDSDSEHDDDDEDDDESDTSSGDSDDDDDESDENTLSMYVVLKPRDGPNKNVEQRVPFKFDLLHDSVHATATRVARTLSLSDAVIPAIISQIQEQIRTHSRRKHARRRRRVTSATARRAQRFRSTPAALNRSTPHSDGECTDDDESSSAEHGGSSVSRVTGATLSLSALEAAPRPAAIFDIFGAALPEFDKTADGTPRKQPRDGSAGSATAGIVRSDSDDDDAPPKLHPRTPARPATTSPVNVVSVNIGTVESTPSETSPSESREKSLTAGVPLAMRLSNPFVELELHQHMEQNLNELLAPQVKATAVPMSAMPIPLSRSNSVAHARRDSAAPTPLAAQLAGGAVATTGEAGAAAAATAAAAAAAAGAAATVAKREAAQSTSLVSSTASSRSSSGRFDAPVADLLIDQ